MRISVGAFFLAAVTAAAASQAASHNPGGLVSGKSTVAETMQSFGAPSDTTMNPDGALTLYYQGARLGDANARIVALHFGADFVYRDAQVAGRSIVYVTDLASR